LLKKDDSAVSFTKTKHAMDSTNVQVAFFNHVKSLLPPHLSLVDEVAELLNISNDSAYRRIRGEKPITIEEVQKLATHFKMSLDQFLHLQSDSFIFTGKLANATDHIFEKWMENMLQQMMYMNSFQHKHLYYLLKDIPPMQQFLSPELICFKSFFWRKSILHYEAMRGQKLSLKNIDPRHVEMGRKIVEVYNQIPSTDIWNIESINTTIRQIQFYREANIFDTPEDVEQLYRGLLKLIDHLEKQADYGLKFLMDGEPNSNSAPYNLFNNELILGDNTAMAELDNRKITFLNHSVINFITTQDERFNAHMFDNLQNLIKKSTQLSRVGEKERTRFFNRIRDKVKQVAKL
jgi:plasmid maintenance system antidote protein VapI